MALADTRSSHLWAALPGNFDRLNTRALYASSNQWGIPDLPVSYRVPTGLVAYNDRRACERAIAGDAVHFFLDDYRFETVWTKPERPLSRLARVGAALTPDFSLWRDMPIAMQAWQTYRARWCGMWMLEHGIAVVPTVSWSTEESYRFAFAGISAGSVVAVSTVGAQKPDARSLFEAGYRAMIEAIQPARVLLYGKVPAWLDGDETVRGYPTRWQERQPARAAADNGGQ